VYVPVTNLNGMVTRSSSSDMFAVLRLKSGRLERCNYVLRGVVIEIQERSHGWKS